MEVVVGLKSSEAEMKEAGEEVAVAKPVLPDYHIVNSTLDVAAVVVWEAAEEEEVGTRNPAEAVEVEQYRHIEGEEG